ncbi:MAG: CDP-diacylglycerol--serine O-phosphatidyltransferase [Verrucomicrobiales bacterium]|jgi:CDP-diacylglycerol--serine O-phosphatidyltransferase
MPDNEPKIYLLPNLMTAGNLFCGFMAVLTVFKGIQLSDVAELSSSEEKMAMMKLAYDQYQLAILLIFGSCLFDVLDGRLARLGGQDSPFGREFDSIVDVVSFGVAPALLVFKAVLFELPDRIGWLIAFVYLLCGAMRLARFNCMAAEGTGGKNFRGFPIPAAAGVISSITLMLIWLNEGSHEIWSWSKYVLAALMIFLSMMMMGRKEYPSFKQISWRTQGSLPRILALMLVLVFTAYNYQWMPAVLFVTYLLYGFVRPLLPGNWRREIEDAESDVEE